MAKAQDPPSPVDDYGTPPPPVPIGDATPVAVTPPPYSASQPGGAQPQYYAQPRATNTLAIVALIASCAGVVIPFADIAGIVMGFIALSQIKRTGENGRGLAVGAVIAGFAILFIELLVIVGYFVFLFWVIGVADSASNLGSDFG